LAQEFVDGRNLAEEIRLIGGEGAFGMGRHEDISAQGEWEVKQVDELEQVRDRKREEYTSRALRMAQLSEKKLCEF